MRIMQCRLEGDEKETELEYADSTSVEQQATAKAASTSTE